MCVFRHFKLGVLAFGLALTAGPTLGQAQAQWAIGDGGALERNLRRGDSHRIPIGRDFAREFAFRNSIVTGNTPQGLRFRGDVGYLDAFEFRGTVGSELSDAFRRDALYSGLAGFGIRGIDALQYQYAMTTGSTPPVTLTGTLTTHRFGGGVYIGAATATRQPGTTQGHVGALRPLAEVDPFVDDRGKGLWTLRSTSAYAASRSFRPSLLRMWSTPGGNALVTTASALRGVETISIGKLEKLRGMSPDMSLPGRPEPRQNNGAEPVLPGTPPGGDAPMSGAVPTVRDIAGLNFHAELLRRYEAYADSRYGRADPQSGADDWRTSIATLRDYLGRPLPDFNAESGAVEPSRVEPPTFLPKTLDLLRNAPGRIDSLVPDEADQIDAFGLHMKAGEQLLADGRFFGAEERFTRALAQRPGDTIADAARIHAQIGAGLYVSAALNLRAHFEEHPETIGMRFSRRLLPQGARFSVVVAQLQDKVAGERSIRGESALLLAYLGHQTQDAILMRQGLDAMERLLPDDHLAPILRTIWVQIDPP